MFNFVNNKKIGFSNLPECTTTAGIELFFFSFFLCCNEMYTHRRVSHHWQTWKSMSWKRSEQDREIDFEIGWTTSEERGERSQELPAFGSNYNANHWQVTRSGSRPITMPIDRRQRLNRVPNSTLTHRQLGF